MSIQKEVHKEKKEGKREMGKDWIQSVFHIQVKVIQEFLVG